MSLAKTMDELEKHIDYANSYFADVKQELETLETDYTLEIHELKKDIETMAEQNELLEEKIDDLFIENKFLESKIAQLEFELVEVVITNKRYELDI